MTVFILSAAVIFLSVYLLMLKKQIRGINKQLDERLQQQTRQPVTLELINKELNELAANISRCLKAEEILRLSSIHENNHFKDLIANISHDLRTPLTAIKGYQQLIEQGELTEQQTERFRIVRKHADELEALIEHFFEYSYLVNAGEVPELETLNLTNLLAECLADNYSQFEKRNISVLYHSSNPVYVCADRKMLTRIIQNLIRNCLFHSAGDVEVKMEAKTPVSFIFRNPVCNSEMEIDHIFDRFYTADASRSKTTGLGLAIVRMLAEIQDGKAEACLQDGHIELKITLPPA